MIPALHIIIAGIATAMAGGSLYTFSLPEAQNAPPASRGYLMLVAALLCAVAFHEWMHLVRFEAGQTAADIALMSVLAGWTAWAWKTWPTVVDGSYIEDYITAMRAPVGSATQTVRHEPAPNYFFEPSTDELDNSMRQHFEGRVTMRDLENAPLIVWLALLDYDVPPIPVPQSGDLEIPAGATVPDGRVTHSRGGGLAHMGLADGDAVGVYMSAYPDPAPYALCVWRALHEGPGWSLIQDAASGTALHSRSTYTPVFRHGRIIGVRGVSQLPPGWHNLERDAPP